MVLPFVNHRYLQIIVKGYNINVFTIRLPLPPKECQPNARVHWAARWRAGQRHKTRARSASSRIVEHLGTSPLIMKASVKITFYHKIRRRRDPDNALASMKAAIDGLVESGLLGDDSQLTYLPVEFRLVGDTPGVTHPPHVEIKIEPMDH